MIFVPKPSEMKKLVCVVLSSLILTFVVVVDGKVDLTRNEKIVGASVADAVADVISESCIFSDDALFLRRMAFGGTMDGRAANTFTRNGTDYFGGIWQVR